MSFPKPAERRQRRGKRDVGLVALDAAPLQVRKPPSGLTKATVAAWERLWGSPLARTP